MDDILTGYIKLVQKVIFKITLKNHFSVYAIHERNRFCQSLKRPTFPVIFCGSLILHQFLLNKCSSFLIIFKKPTSAVL